MNTSINYTSGVLENTSPIYPNSLMSIEAEADVNSSFGSIWFSPIPAPLGWRFSLDIFPASIASFIGILTDDEAKEMKEGISLFKKSFDDDLARRNKILFGE
ncbi:MAG: hypothetical protein NTZ18_03355 [Candidatus Komeilibacteria bacterium]|nr:hypothetical protein [Candidatus Komeilibacteria bacterium]